MYTFVLALHNFNRWLLLLAGLGSLVGLGLWLRTQTRPTWLRGTLRAWVVLFDVQLLLGLVLFGISPVLQAGHRDPLGHPEFRYFLMEHTLPMLLALILVHWGSRRVRQEEEPCLCTMWPLFLAYLLMLIAIPWFRPLFR